MVKVKVRVRVTVRVMVMVRVTVIVRVTMKIIEELLESKLPLNHLQGLNND